jgi:2-oxoisovalerate dehydrogenase E2 component (dihydrolipoyl transacylase)
MKRSEGGVSVFSVKLPDVGEGIAEAELVSWLVGVGDHVKAEAPLAEVMTDKATVEISSPVSGVVTFLHGEPGQMLAVGTEFVGIELEGSGPTEASAPVPDAVTAPIATAMPSPAPNVTAPTVTDGHRPTAAPAVRQRARELGIDLGAVPGTGPGGRIVHADLDRVLGGSQAGGSATGRGSGVEIDDTPHVEAIRGLRRRIGERLTTSSQIPTITYVDAVDATDLELLRAELNRRESASGVRLTVLPFLVRAMVIAVGEQPRLNARYDSVGQSLSVFDVVHVGIATQTPDGLMVPVVRHAESRGLWDLATEVGRVSGAAREGRATLQELTGSTITITSLGALGGLVTTPLINEPEVAIVGVNKMEMRPVWRNGSFEPRQMFNLSSSFDHRIVDGWDAATFIQRVKSLLEMPALLFVDDQR